MVSLRISLVVFLFLALHLQTISQTPTIVLETRVSGLSQPIDVVNAGDGTNRLFVAQKGGTVKVYSSSYNFLGDLVTVSDVRTSGNEEGLLSIAFHPDYENNRYFYVYYTNTAGDLELARYQTRSDDPNLADPASKVIVMTIPHPVFNNHNGAKLLFGPDGYLYFATGDGGDANDPNNNAQTGTNLLGKMVRISVTTTGSAPYYTIPSDNPYVGVPGIMEEIFAAGLRNPFRWSFDRLNGDMWIGDVGQNDREEINYRAAESQAAANYGWRCYEGTLPNNTTDCEPQEFYVSPIYEYPTQPSPSAVTGGIVYRGTAYPDLYGYYVAAEFYASPAPAPIILIVPDGSGGWNVTTQAGVPGIAGFGESESGELYAVRLTTGELLQVTTAAAVPVTIVNFHGTLRQGKVDLTWRVASEQNVERYDVEFSSDGTSFSKLGSVKATGANTYRFVHDNFNARKGYYRLRTVDLDATFALSRVIAVSGGIGAKFLIRPTLITNRRLNIFLDSGLFDRVEVLNSSGVVVMNQRIPGTGSISLQLPILPAGNYLVRVIGGEEILTQKIVIR